MMPVRSAGVQRRQRARPAIAAALLRWRVRGV